MNRQPYIEDKLVDQLSPPVWRPNAEDSLTRIRADLERAEADRESWESEDTDKTRAQLEAARMALEHLGPRAARLFGRRLDDALAEMFPRELTWTLEGPGVGIPCEAQMTMLITALDRAVVDVRDRSKGRKGRLSGPAAVTALSLIEMFCAAHEKPFPTLSAKTWEPATFALRCLRAWNVCDNRLTERALIRAVPKRAQNWG